MQVYFGSEPMDCQIAFKRFEKILFPQAELGNFSSFIDDGHEMWLKALENWFPVKKEKKRKEKLNTELLLCLLIAFLLETC